MKYIIIFVIFSLQNSQSYGNELYKLVGFPVGKALDFLASSSGLAGQPLSNNQNVSRPIEDEVNFWCRNRTTGEDFQVLPDDVTAGGRVVSSQPFVFIIHGWVANRTTRWVDETMRDFIQFVDDVNICAIDWSGPAYYEYQIAAQTKSYEVGNYIADVFEKWELNLNNVTLVAHSMGAQIAGQIGKKLDGKIGKVIALDPAGPLYCYPLPVSTSLRLDETDAKYVQVISTCNNFLGCALISGHATFYANGGGAPQPACPLLQFDPENSISCSHGMATEYFRLSLNPDIQYMARDYGLLFNVKEDIMGYRAAGTSGNFCLKMASSPPYVKSSC